MNIELHEIAVRDLVAGYEDNGDEGVVGYGGKLDIRPKYQREFIYSPEQQRAVMNTVLKGFPLNTMYWAVRGDGSFEVIDGQQRTLSVCKFANGDFSIPWNGNTVYWHNFQDDMREKVLGYKMMVYFCEGSDTEKLDWFRTINIAGEVFFTCCRQQRNLVQARR